MCQINPSKSGLHHLPYDTDVSFLPMELIGEDSSLLLEEIRSLEQVWQGYTYFQNGDIIIAKITPCFENGKGALCAHLVNGIGFGTTELHVLRAKRENEPLFIFYLTKILEFRESGKASMTGSAGQKRVSDDFIQNFRMGFPPLPEQRAIAAFLDHETTNISTLVAKKERLISLLREKRTALISHAVTKGLDSMVEMRASGVEWLGEIPAHWEVRRLKYVAAFFGGGTPSKGVSAYWSGDIPWVSPKDMKAEIIKDAEDHITEEAVENSSTRLIQPGAVLIVVRSGILKHSIPVAINVQVVALNQDMKAVIPKSCLQSSYLASLISSHQDSLLVEWRKAGATVESIEHELLVNTPCPIPPVPEQQAIASYLNNEITKIDALISTIQGGIKKLQEYSNALISAAVTGKIDVREG